MRIRFLIIPALSSALTLLLVGVGGPVTSAVAVTTCTPPSHIGNDNPQMGEILADGATPCSMATKAIAKGHLNHGGNLVTPGWKCRATHKLDQTGLVLGATISCTKGVANKYVFVFQWST